MLEPEDRRLLTDALRPPEGLELSFAIGTTFTLDLLALLVTPLTFALLDWQEGEAEAEPLALLEAARQYAERMAVFCHGGYIRVPSADQALFQYLEGSVFECTAPLGGLFHPKIWLLRFTVPESPEEPPVYRLITQTRNLSFDRSWDAFLVLEAASEPWRERAYVASRPIASLIRMLPRLARDVPRPVRERISLMAREVERTKWSAALPEGFTEVKFWATGLEHADWAFQGSVSRALVMAPFVGPAMLERFTRTGRKHVLISRQESLDALPRESFGRFEQVFVFDDQSVVAAVDPELPEAEPTQLPYLAGLHAKLYVADAGQDASVWIGSLNATDAAWQRNVEFLVELIGPRWKFGVEALLRQHDKTVALRDLLQPYEPPLDPIGPSEEEEAAYAAIEHGREAIMAARLSLAADEIEGRCSMALQGAVKLRGDVPVTIECWPIRMSQAVGGRRLIPTSDPPHWKLDVQDLSSFVAFEIVAPGGYADRFVRNLPLTGAPEDRNERLLRALLGTPERLLRFLLFLLADGDPASASELIAGVGDPTSVGQNPQPFVMGLPLFEAMIRALGRSPEKLDHVHRIVHDLGRDENGKSLLPEGFESIWEPIWNARETLR